MTVDMIHGHIQICVISSSRVEDDAVRRRMAMFRMEDEVESRREDKIGH